MKSANNSTLFTDISAKESSTFNGGSLISKPADRWKIVRDPKTGKFSIQCTPSLGSFFPQLTIASNFPLHRF